MSARRLTSLILLGALALFLLLAVSQRTVARFEPGVRGTIVRLMIPPGSGPVTLVDRKAGFSLVLDDSAAERFLFVRSDGVVSFPGGGKLPSERPLTSVEVRAPRLFSMPLACETAALDDFDVGADVKMLQGKAISALFDLLAAPPDPSLRSLKSDGKADTATAAVTPPALREGRLFTWIADWKDADDYSFLSVYAGAVVAGETSGGRLRVLGVSEVEIPRTVHITCARFAGGLAVHAAGRMFLLPAKSATGLTSGFLGVARNMKIESLHLFASSERPVDFRDSFMRAEDAGLWKPACGRWEIFGMQHPEDSSNPFSLAFSSVEIPPFMHLHERGKAEKTGMGVRLLKDRATGEIIVTDVLDGSPASEAGIRRNDRIVAVQGEPARAYSLGKLAELLGREGKPVALDIERGEKRLSIAITPGVVDYTLSRYRPDRRFIGDFPLGGKGVITAGENFWRDYEYSVTLKPYGSGTVGLLFRYLDEANHLLLRWNSDDPEAGEADALELVSVTNGKKRLLAGTEGGFLPGHYYRLTVRCRGERVEAFVDGHLMLSSAGAALPCGRIGLAASGVPGAVFDDVCVEGLTEPYAGAVFRTQAGFRKSFVTDRIMKQWADVRNDWKRLAQPDTGKWGRTAERGRRLFGRKTLRSMPLYLNTYRYFGDASLGVENPAEAPFAAGICADVSDGWSGCALLAYKDGTLELTTPDAVLASTVGPGKRPPRRLEFAKEGNRFVVRAGGKVVLAAPVPPSFRHGGEIWVLGVEPSLPGEAEKRPDSLPGAVLYPSSPSTFEYTFDKAPCDWDVAEGEWGTMNRWVCTPDWSYFGGRSPYHAAIWNKKTFKGDLNLDFFVGFAMPSYVRMPAEKPSDIGITLFGDGRNVISGFALLLAHEVNSYSLYFLEGKKRKFAAKLSVSPERFDMRFHQGWIRLSLLVRGDKLTLSVSGRRVLETDLPAHFKREGKVGLWLLDNSYLIARAHLSASEAVDGPPALKRFKAGVVGPFDNRTQNGISCIVEREGTREGEEVFSIRPLYGGGPNEVFLRRGKIDLAASPVLEFAYLAEGSPAWDFCFDYKGRRCKVGLFGARDITEETQYLGRFETRELGGGWRLARADLAALLASVFPGETEAEITSPRLAAYYAEDLVQAGWKRNRTTDRLLLSGLMFRPRSGGEETLTVRSVEAVWGRKGPAVVLKGRFPPGKPPVLETPAGEAALFGKPMVLEGETMVLPVAWPVPLGQEVRLTVKSPGGTKLWSGRVAMTALKGAFKGEPALSHVLDWNKVPPERAPITFDFDSPWRCTETYDKSGRWRVGFQKPAVATDLARVVTDDPTLGYSLRALCTDLAQVFGVSLPVRDLLSKRPSLRFLIGKGGSFALRALSLQAHFRGGAAFAFELPRDVRRALFDRAGEVPLRAAAVDFTKETKSSTIAHSRECTTLDLGDFADFRGHYDGTYFLLDEVSLVPPLTGDVFPDLVILCPRGVRKAKLTLRPKPEKSFESPLPAVETTPSSLGGCLVRFKLDPSLKLEGKLSWTARITNAKGREESISGRLSIDNMPPWFTGARYRIHDRRKVIWLSLAFVEGSGLSPEAEIFLNGEPVPGSERDITVSGETMNIRMGEKYYGEAHGKGALISIRGVKDVFGNTKAGEILIRIGGAGRGEAEVLKGKL